MNSSPALGSESATMAHKITADGATPRKPAYPRQRFFTVAEVAAFLDVSVRSVRRWIKSGELVAHHFGTAVAHRRKRPQRLHRASARPLSS